MESIMAAFRTEAADLERLSRKSMGLGRTR
jgi:hypothetical protein